jgi:carbon-monoxide dehydrogenase iron sulfur subunit
MMKIVLKEEVCMGCSLCEVHCSIQNSRTKDIIKAYKSERPRPKSRIRVEVAKPLSIANRCQHCENPSCVFACLSGAMRFDDDKKMVVHNREKCIGCWTCVMVCPFDAVFMDVSSKVVFKCDLCPDLDVPACVSSCPNEALVLVKEATS